MKAEEHEKAISRDTSNAVENPHCGSWAAEIVCAAHICAALDRLTAAVEAQTLASCATVRSATGKRKALRGMVYRDVGVYCDGTHAAPPCYDSKCWRRVLHGVAP